MSKWPAVFFSRSASRAVSPAGRGASVNTSNADRHILDRMATGDQTALADLYDRHATAVYSLALRIVGLPADAEDVTQEVFAQAWRTADRYDRARGEVAAWLLMMARTRAIDCLRRRRGSSGGGIDDDRVAAIPDPGPSVEYIVATGEQVARVRAALGELPPEQRATLELAYYEGLTQSEIAERTSTPLGTVKTRVRTALDALRRAMTPAANVAGNGR